MLKGYSLKEFNSWHTGGKCSLIIAPHTVGEAIDFFTCCKNEHKDFYILGGGTNVLVAEGFIDKAVLYTGHIKKLSVTDKGDYTELDAACGCTTKQLIACALQNSLSGLEFLTGIPGTLGGALNGNAGGRSDKGFNRIVSEITTIDKNCQIKKYAPDEIMWRYRTCPVDTDDLLIASCKMILYKMPQENIIKEIRQYAELKKGQPIGRATAGCVFKNPQGYSAGRLLDECGCKGLAVRDAVVSESHANFIENKKNASSDDIFELINICRQKVYERFGVKLEYEIQFIGDFKEE